MTSLPPFRRTLTPNSIVLGEPTKSIAAAAPPPVASITCFTASGAALLIVVRRKPDSNHWYRVMQSTFRERLMFPPLDFPPPEKSALTGDENAGASRGTDGSNPVPSSGESSEPGVALTRVANSKDDAFVDGAHPASGQVCFRRFLRSGRRWKIRDRDPDPPPVSSPRVGPRCRGSPDPVWTGAWNRTVLG